MATVAGNPRQTPGQTPITPALPLTGGTTIAAISLAPSANNGDNLVVAAVAGQTVRVHRMVFTVSGAVNVTFYDGTSGAGTAKSGAIQLQGAGSSITLDISGEPWYVTSAGNGFNIFTSAAVTVSGTIWYVQS